MRRWDLDDFKSRAQGKKDMLESLGKLAESLGEFTRDLARSQELDKFALVLSLVRPAGGEPGAGHVQNYYLGEQELIMALLSQLNDEVLEQVEALEPVPEQEPEQDARSRARSLGLRVIKGGRDSETVH